MSGWFPDPEGKKNRLRLKDVEGEWTDVTKLNRRAFWCRAGWITLASAAGLFALVLIVAIAVAPPESDVAASPAPASASKEGSAPAKPKPAPAPTEAKPTTPSPTPAPKSSPPPKPKPKPKPEPKPKPKPEPKEGTALAAVAALTVKGRAPQTGYDRDGQYGNPWIDTDQNGCDQRNDVLNRDLHRKRFDGCTVLAGVLDDPYSGQRIRFKRGQDTSAEVQIDHIVALSDSWQKGTQSWSEDKRIRFANDTLNLMAVDGPTNASKGDGDTATWLPPKKSYRCEYVSYQVAVKKKYNLWVTAAEQDAMERVLTTCPEMKLPKREPIPSHPAPKPKPKPAPPPAEPEEPKDQDEGGGNCAPGYDPCLPPYPPDLDCSDVVGPIKVSGSDPHGLDGDGDGWGCTS